MPRLPATLTRALALATALVTLLPAGVIAQDLDDVVREREALEVELDDTVATLEDLRSRIASAEDDLAALGDREAELVATMAVVRQQLELRARATYMRRGPAEQASFILSSGSPGIAMDRARLLEAVNKRELGTIEGAQALSDQLEQVRTLMVERSEELAGLEADLAAQAELLGGQLDRVLDKEAELRSREERQRIISNGVQNGTYACIMAPPYHFIDSWGFARSGGRRHKGTDVMGKYGAQVYAFTNGTISTLKTNRLGGIVLYLRGDDGVRYYYAHLSGYADGIRPGKRVEAGELIAYNGNSGNARGTAPHIHFEVSPGGGQVNPYPWLAPACF